MINVNSVDGSCSSVQRADSRREGEKKCDREKWLGKGKCDSNETAMELIVCNEKNIMQWRNSK
jgi:hypothetical protein